MKIQQMVRIVLILGIGALLQGCVFSRTASPKVTGYIFDEQTKAPIAECQVGGLMTDSSGYYEFEEIRIRGLLGVFKVYSMDVNFEAVKEGYISDTVAKRAPYGGYAKGAHWEMDTVFLNRDMPEVTQQFDTIWIEDLDVPFSEFYFHNDTLQYYDYSNQWDFDGDGIKDSLLFIGDHGAHLHFYPRIVLSSNLSLYEFRTFWIDMPYPDRSKEDLMKSPGIQLVIDNFDDDAAFEIYLNIDGNNGYPYGESYPKDWTELGISTTSVLLNFEKETLSLTDYEF